MSATNCRCIGRVSTTSISPTMRRRERLQPGRDKLSLPCDSSYPDREPTLPGLPARIGRTSRDSGILDSGRSGDQSAYEGWGCSITAKTRMVYDANRHRPDLLGSDHTRYPGLQQRQCNRGYERACSVRKFGGMLHARAGLHSGHLHRAGPRR